MASNEMRVTEKGQVTIPVEVRRALNLHPHDRVSFEVDPQRGVAIVRHAPSVVRALFGAVQAIESEEGDIERRQALERRVADEVVGETE
jgi:AbrB family looped-hinge helix DNA binding protein